MPYCQACGAGSPGASKFCLQCGEALPSDTNETPARSAWSRLGWAGPLPALFFLLPWITVSCQAVGVSQSFTGLSVATGFTVRGPFGGVQKVAGEPILFLVPLAGVALAVLLWAALRIRVGHATVVSAFCIVVAALGLVVMGVKYLQWESQLQREGRGMITLSPNVGFVLSVLSFVAAGAGGAVNLVEHRRRAVPSLSADARLETRSSVGAREPAPMTARVQTDQFCSECGARFSQSGKFCVDCGHLLA